MNKALEVKMIQRFIKKEKQSRYIGFVSSPKNRTKFINQFSHFKDFNEQLFDEIAHTGYSVLESRLKNIFGDPSCCYVISDDKSLDGHTIPLQVAYDELFFYSEFILVFGDAELVYYEGEPPHNRYISRI